MNVLFLLTYYNINDGSSTALYQTLLNNSLISSYKILSRQIDQVQDGLNIAAVRNEKEVIDECTREKYDVIHYFKAAGMELFHWVCCGIKRGEIKKPIITTVCQRPSYPQYLLTPEEIKYSNKFVFIDRTAYNDSLLNFIPVSQKVLNYFGDPATLIEETDKILSQNVDSSHNGIIYGRGSTQVKCPRNMIDVFDSINVEKKQFIVAGCDNGNTWLHKAVKGRNDIQLYGKLPYAEWLSLCSMFDVFLYQIPEDAHSSLDGVLSQAMLLKKPVVYYGADAPKERFIHGVNGFVANTYEEISEYATLLGKNPEMRKEMGEKARRSTIEMFSIQNTIDQYNKLYREILDTYSTTPVIAVPKTYCLFFIRHLWFPVLKMYMKGGLIEKIYRKYEKRLRKK